MQIPRISVGLSAHALPSLHCTPLQRTHTGMRPRTTMLSRQLDAYLAQGFGPIEYHLTLPDLPQENILKTFFAYPTLEVLWYTSILDLTQALLFFVRPEWGLFLSTIAERCQTHHRIVLALDRSVPYDATLFSQLLTEWENIRLVLPCIVAFEHSSWKKAEPVLARMKIPQMEIDAPRLPGIIKPIASGNQEHVYLRLVGRNAKTWLLQHPSDRFDYDYSQSELRQIAKHIRELESQANDVAVIFATYPPEHCIRNAQQLEELLSIPMER